VAETAAAYVSTVLADAGAGRPLQRIQADAATRPILLDLPLLRDVGFGALFEDAETVVQAHAGRDPLPLAPVHVTAARTGSPASIALSWVRRTRIGGEWRDDAARRLECPGEAERLWPRACRFFPSRPTAFLLFHKTGESKYRGICISR
jgi:hypothetical protein